MRKVFKKIENKILKILLTLILSLVAIVPTVNQLNAVTYNVQERFLGNWTAVAGGSEGLYGNGTVLTVNGQISFCLQANKAAATGPNNIITPGDIGLSEEQVGRLSLIAWYGYRNQPSDDNYMLTQNLIWQETGYKSYYKSAAYPNKTAMQSWFNSVLDQVNNFGNLPSFNGSTHTVNLGQTLTLEDTNGVLNGLNITSVTGASVTKNGDVLHITPDSSSPDNLTIRFNRGLTSEQTVNNFVVRSGGSQAVSPCLSGGDPYRAFVNIRINKFGSVEIAKQDNNGAYVPDTSFMLSYNSDMSSPIGTYTTGANGKIKVDQLLPQTIYVQETAVPNHLTLDSTIRSVVIIPNDVISYNAINNLKLGEINLEKQDSETIGNSQGNTSLLGAKYGLYANADIINPSTGVVTYTKDTLISEQTIDINRKITWNNLFLGSYYVKETVSPLGYNLDPTKHVVNVTSSNPEDTVIKKDVLSKEDVIRGNIYLVKYLDDSINNPALQNPGKNIVFKITSKTTGQSFYIKTNEHGHASTINEYYTDEACTNKVTSNSRGALPFDNYTIQEVASTTPPGYNPAPAWEVSISNESEVLHYIVENTDITTPVKVVKVDKTTGKVIPVANTEFRLLDSNKKPIKMTTYYPETVVHETFKTSVSGSFQFPNHLAYGTYYLEEINAPLGYLKGELLEFKVTTTSDWNTPLVIEYTDNPSMGRVKVHKIDETTNQDIENTILEVRAREDIVTPDGTVRAVKDELLDTLTTDQGGLDTSKDLFLGKYYVKELKQAPGMSLSAKEYDFELLYKDQETAIVETSVEITNTPTSLKIVKKDSNTDDLLSDVKYKVWNKDIANKIENKDIDLGFGLGNDLLDPIFNFMTTYVTDENGEINIKYLTPGTYNIAEVEAVSGYILDSTVHEFVVDENGMIENKSTYELELTNTKTKTTFTKTDVEGKLLEDAEFDIIDPITDKVVTSFASKLEPIAIEKLINGKDYLLRETKSPEGYSALTEDIRFIVDGTNTSITVINKLLLTSIEVNKVDSQTNKAIISKDFEFTMYSDKECTMVLDTVNANMEDGTATFKNVEYGQTVYIKETGAPAGYQLSNEVKEITLDMELEGIGDVHSFVYLNTMMPIISTKVETNDTTNIFMLVTLATFSLGLGAGIVAIIIKKRKGKE